MYYTSIDIRLYKLAIINRLTSILYKKKTFLVSQLNEIYRLYAS